MLDTVFISEKVREFEYYEDMMSALEESPLNIATYVEGSCMQNADNAILLATTKKEVEAAKAAGMAVLGYHGRENAEENLHEAGYIVTSLDGADEDLFKLVYAREHGLPLEIAKTEHLIIREMTKSDFGEYYDILRSVPKETIENIPLESREDCYEWFCSYIENKYEFYDYGYWGAFTHDGTMIGSAGVEVTKREDVETVNELGYLIGAAFQGKGYSKECIRAVIEYAKDKLGMEELCCFIEKGNLKSEKALMSALKGLFVEIRTVEYTDRKGIFF